jgi:hypothetical protein
VPLDGSASRLLRCDAVKGRSMAELVRLSKSSEGNPQGDSGAACRISSGIAQASRSLLQRSAASIGSPEMQEVPADGAGTS